MSTQQLAQGEIFAGYRIEDEIGRGGMGVVYRATDFSLDRPVALKLIAPELAADEDFRKRFLRESRLAASLGHPHVLPVHAAGEEEGQLYLAMRYVEGEDLKALLARQGALEPTQALKICGQVGEALDVAHRRGLVHRDVKPANVLLDDDGEAYLADFGLTKQAGGASTKTGEIAGTLDYLAPEQIRGEEVDGRTDEYALACLLYECLSGLPPFRRRTEAETLWAHMQEPSPALRDYPALDPVFARGLAKEREERFPSCTELVDSAREALGFETPRVRRRRKLLRRSRALIAAGALVLAGTAVALIVALVTGGATRLEPARNAVAGIDAKGGEPVWYTEVGTTPSTIAVGEGAIWVLNADDRTISKIDPETGLTRTFATGGTPTDLAVGEGAVWVGNGAEQLPTFGNVYMRTVSKVDPDSTTVREPAVLPGAESEHAGDYRVAGVSQLAAGAGAVWAINPDLSVSRIDAATGAVRKRIPVKAGRAIAAGREGVWVLGTRGPEVIEIDPRDGKAGQRISVSADGLWGLAVGAGSVWATDLGMGVLWRIEPGVDPVMRPIDVGRGVTAVAYGGGAIWVTNFVDNEVVRVDVRTNAVTARIRLAGTPASVAADAETAWASVAGAPSGGVLPASACGPVLAGGRQPDVLIASDLPLQGPGGRITRVASDAIRFVLRQHGFRAGSHTVGYQSCDDSTAQTGNSDFLKCASNAKAYAATTRVVGVIGPWQSYCAWVQIPIANRAEGPLAMISPSNTHQGLTHPAPGVARDEPGIYYPTGVRNYVRVTGSFDLDGVAGAVLADELGLRHAYVLRSTRGQGEQLTTPFRRAARSLGIRVVGSATWNPDARSYRSLAARVAAARPDGVFIGDELFANGGAVVKALRARLGSDVVLIAGDSFVPIEELLRSAGRSAIGTYVITSAVAHEGLSDSGRRFVRRFGRTQPGGIVPSADYVIETAQAAEALLAAIERSDGTRASVVKELRGLAVENGILGSFRFDRNGDITPASFTVFRVTGERKRDPSLPDYFAGAVVDRVVRVPPVLARP